MYEVIITKQMLKKMKGLPRSVKEKLVVLITEIEKNGPVRGNWKNYGKLSPTEHHCHLKSGRPTYVVCWRTKVLKVEIEVYYVGTHEKAPY